MGIRSLGRHCSHFGADFRYPACTPARVSQCKQASPSHGRSLSRARDIGGPTYRLQSRGANQAHNKSHRSVLWGVLWLVIECGLTLPSRGLARARRASLVRHFPLRAPCPREPLMSHVSHHKNEHPDAQSLCRRLHRPPGITVVRSRSDRGLSKRAGVPHPLDRCTRRHIRRDPRYKRSARDGWRLRLPYVFHWSLGRIGAGDCGV